MSSTTRKDATPTEPQMKLAIAQTLSQPFAYNAPVVMLDFSVNDQGEFEGKFKDATRPRIFSFNIKGQSVTFKPYTPGRMDSVDDWEEFSSGYSYRVDAGIGGNKKPQCVKPTAYNCGKACINIMKSCKIKTDDPTIKDRLKNLEGIGKNYAKTTKSTKSQKMSESVKIAKVDPIIEAEKPIEKPAEKQAQEKTKPLSNAQINAQTIEKLAKKAGVDISELEETAKKAGATEAQLLTLKNAVAKYQKTKGIVSGSQIKTTRSEEEGLTGDGSHKGMPRNAQEYYNLATKNGKQITLKEAQDTVEAIDDWTGDGYEEIRKDQKEGRVNERATLIDNYIKNLTPYKGEVYRGIIFDNKKEMEDWLKGDKDGVLGNQNAHASWSSELEVAKGFADIEEDDPDRVPVVIKSVNNKSGVSIANLSRFGEPESEVIVSKDAKHKVKSVREEGGVVYVEVEEVDPMTEKESSKSKDKSVISKPKAENQNPIPAAEKTVEPKTKPEAEKQPVKNLAGDGTHDGAPKNAQEYYDAVTKTGKQITLKEAQDTANAIKYWTGKGSSEIREDQKNGRENKQADQIDEFIKNSTPYKGEIYRGITFSSEDEAMKWAKGDKDGIVGNQSAHSSWTSDIAIAAHFTELDFSGEKSTQVIIKSTNKSGASIRNLSVFGKPEAGKLGRDEKEVVVSKNTRHKFKGVTKKDGILYVEVEEVDTPIEKPAKQEEVKSQEEVKAQQQPPVRKVGKLTPSLASKEDQIKTAKEWSSTAKQFKIKGNKVLNALSEDDMIGGKKVDRKALKNMLELVSDSSIVIDGLIFYAQEKPGKQDTIFLKDESGDAQGFFTVGNEKSKDSMYIEFLGTNPLNIIQSKKGVGKQIMYQAIQESIKRGLKGQIKLESLSTSESFYEAMGFQRRTEKIFEDGKYYDMEYFDLSEESAKAFVKEYEKKLKQDKI
jgi:hypothetical protein